MTGRESLNIIDITLDYCSGDKKCNKELVDAIDKRLKKLEIIEKHKLLNYVLKNPKCAEMYQLSNEEIEILKEKEDD